MDLKTLVVTWMDLKTLVVRNCFLTDFYRKYLLPEVSILLFIFSLSPATTITSEDVCCKHTKRQVNTVKFLDHALSTCSVCNRYLLSFPFGIEMTEEQEYLCCSLYFVLFTSVGLEIK